MCRLLFWMESEDRIRLVVHLCLNPSKFFIFISFFVLTTNFSFSNIFQQSICKHNAFTVSYRL